MNYDIIRASSAGFRHTVWISTYANHSDNDRQTGWKGGRSSRSTPCFFRGILSARTWFVAVRKFGVTRDLWTLDRLIGLTGSFWHQFQLYRHFTNANFKYSADKCGLKSTLRRFKTGTSKPDFEH